MLITFENLEDARGDKVRLGGRDICTQFSNGRCIGVKFVKCERIEDVRGIFIVLKITLVPNTWS